jgi:hypothetical protein
LILTILMLSGFIRAAVCTAARNASQLCAGLAAAVAAHRGHKKRLGAK